MKALTLSPAAAADLEHIWQYSAATWGLDQADRYIEDIRNACLHLASGASRGRMVDVRTGYLKQTVGSHMIYFRDEGERIDVIRILHQRQDVSLNLPN